jgi:hypothetical protein
MRLIGLILLLSLQAKAFMVVGIGADSVTERATDSSVGMTTAMAVFGSVGVGPGLLGLEYSQSNPTVTGENALQVSQLQRNLYFTGLLPAPRYGVVIPYLSAGMGASQQEVQTQILGTSSKDEGSWQAAGFGGVGVRWWLGTGWAQGIYLATEARLLFGADQDPDPSFAPVLRLGFSW